MSKLGRCSGWSTYHCINNIIPLQLGVKMETLFLFPIMFYDEAIYFCFYLIFFIKKKTTLLILQSWSFGK